MSRITIVADERIPFLRGALDEKVSMVYRPGNEITALDVRNADALIVRTRTKCNAALLDGSRVKMIATATIGYDHIDTQYCKRRGIHWTNAPGCNAASVEQYMVSSLLRMVIRHGLDPARTTVGIVGVGNVGTKVKRIARLLGFNVLINDPPRSRREGPESFTGLEQLLEASDVVTLHVPLNPDGPDKTFHMANREFFNTIKKGAILVNTSRGEVVDETALKEALNDGVLIAAYLDVFENEPVIDPQLLGLAEITTPHIAGYSTDGKVNGTKMSVRAISRFFDLGKDDWSPVDVPKPKEPELFADAGSGNILQVVSEVYDATYRIEEDHKALQSAPGAFEELRGNYRIRREPGAYSVRLYNDDGHVRHVLEGLGFGVIGDACF
jgi:erythronate-4-phosphate dehydrogenase